MSESKYETEDFINFHKALEQLLESTADAHQLQGRASFESDGIIATIDISFNFVGGDKNDN